jgi:hypothetical protein
MKNWYWKARYGFYRASGALRRLLGLSFKNSQTLGEVMSGLERDPQMRELIDKARKKTGVDIRHW